MFKCFIFQIMMLLAMAGSSWAVGPTLDLGSNSGNVATTVTVPVTLTNNGASIAAIGMDVGYDATALGTPTATLPAAIGGAGLGFTLAKSTPSAGVFRIGLVNFGGGVTLPDGVVVNVTFTSLKAGNFTLNNTPSAADLNASNVAITGASGSITGIGLNQTITFPTAAGLTFGTPGSVSATSTSGLAVSFSSNTPAVCTVSGSTVTPVATGTCTIAANQAGNFTYNPATPVTQNIAVASANQTIGFGTAPALTFGVNGSVSATATSGLAVSFSSTTPAVCTVSGSTVTPVSTGTCTVAANQAGNSNYNPASAVTQNLNVAAANQTISFGAAPSLTFGGATGTLSANATSGLAVSFTSNTPLVCTVAGNVVTPVAGGSCSIFANQAGNANYNAAPLVTQNFTVAQATQSISFGGAPSLTFGGGTGTLSANATSGLAVGFSSNTPAVCTVVGNVVTPVAGGSCTIFASQAGDGNFLAAPQATQNFTVAQATQSISFGTAPVMTFGANGSVSATATSGLSVSFSSSTPAVCTVSGSTVTPVTAGNCTIAASQAGNGNFLAAPAQTQNFSIALANQTIGFGTAPALTFGVNGSVSATATSGLAVSFSSTTPAVCTVSGSTVTPVATGTCTVAANQAGNGNFNPAPAATQNLTVAAANQTIGFGAAPSLTFGGATGTLNATATSGLAVSFTSNSPLVCSVAGNVVTPVGGGTCSVFANQAGNANYNAASLATQNFTVAQAAQNISFGAAPSLTFGGGTGTLSATATSALAVSFVSNTPLVCTVAGNVVTPVAGGTCTVFASQAGNANFLAAPQATQNFAVAQATQSISFGTAPVMTFGANGSVSATATSGLAVSFSSSTPAVCTVSGSTVTPVSAGNCTIAAGQAGNGNFLAAPAVSQNITIALANQSISFGAKPSLTYHGSNGTLSATSTSGLAVSFVSNTPTICTVSGSTITPVLAGPCVVAASQAGNGNFNPATAVTQSITVGVASQTITFGAVPTMTFGSNGSVSATATSGFAVSFSSNTPAVCTVVGSTVTPVKAGSCTILADQAGDANFSSAPQASQVINIAFAGQTISFGAAPSLTFGGSTGVVSATATSGLPVSFGSNTPAICTVSGSTVTPVGAGTCIIAATQAGNNGFAPATAVTQNISVAAANQTIIFVGAAPALVFGGSAGTLSATATSGLSVSFSSTTPAVCTVSGSAVTPVTVGSCIVAANQAGTVNFNAAPQVTQTITVDVAIPGAPTGVSAVPGNTIATVSFSAPSFTGGSPITSYTIISNPAGGTDSTPGAGTSHIITGLTNGTPYSFTVKATNTKGDSLASAASTSVTPNLLTPTIDQLSATTPLKSGGSVTYQVNYLGADVVTLADADVIVNKTGTASATAVVSGSGTSTRTVTLSGITGDGTIGITIKADTASAASRAIIASASVASATFTVDNTAPALSVNTLADGTVTSNNTLTTGGTASDANGIASLTVNGVSVPVNNGSFSYADPLLAGQNTVTVVATDNAGNLTTDTRTIIYDHSAPVITFTSPTPADLSYTAQANATITGTLNKPGTVKVTVNTNTPVDAVMTGNGFSAPITLALGPNTISVTATDTAVPVANTATVQRTVTFDNNSPEVAITDPAQAITTTLGSYLVQGTVSDQTTPVTLDFKVDGVSVAPAPVPSNGTFQQSVTLSVGKTYTISVTATDKAGNQSTATRSIVYRPLALADALRALQITVGIATQTTDDNVLDVAPLVNGVPAPDGSVDISDADLILRKTVGLVSW